MAFACLLSQPARADVTRTGTLQATVFDDFRGGDSVTRYTLRSGKQETVVVRPTELDAEPGDRVAVTGEMRDGRLVGAVEATGSGAQAQAVAPGPRKTAVILVSFPGGSAEPWSPEATRSEVFTAAASVSAFYEEESHGDISLTGKLRSDGDVFGWYGLDTPTAGCPYNTWKGEADKAATAAGVDLSGYQHLIYEFPYQSSCSWLGTAAAGGGWSMINGNFLGFRAQVTAHELGHNLGLWHAGSWTCHAGGVRVQISDNCTAGEYGDPFDVMGNIGFRHNNSWSLAKLGILTAENVETVEASGTYSIESALDPTTAPTVLRIPLTRNLNGNITSWYYLEVRETGGIFENVADASTTGVSVRATRAGLSPETLLLDANPGTSSFHDAPLAAGALFDGGPVRIRTLSAGGGGATVTVVLDEEPPAAPAGLSATPGFEQVQLQWEPSADDHGVHRYIVFRDGSEVGVSASTGFSDSPVSVGEHEYVVYAEDVSGNRSDPSQPLAVTVESDEEPPSPPTGLTAAPGLEGGHLQWEASTDEFGVDRYVVFRDGGEAGGTGGGTSFVDSLAPVGDHTYVVYAEDLAGNRSDASEPATATLPAVSGPVCASGTCRLTYRHTGAPASWIVPPGIGEAEFTVEGGRGGSESPASIFGAGGRVTATVGSLDGETVTLSVGGAGEPYSEEGGAGGFNGGGDGALGGGGGGFSSVEVGSTLILLAGGGGGEGADGLNSATEEAPAGGRGGRGGERGGPGASGALTQAQGVTLNGGGGGEAGGFGAGGGAGGDPSGAGSCPGGTAAGVTGADGGAFSGGGSTPDAGGGGAGGYVGGGQGAGGAGDACGSTAGAGGGGGGSSFAAPGISAKFISGVRRADGQISIAYAIPVTEPPPDPEPPDQGGDGDGDGGAGGDEDGDAGDGRGPVPIFETPLPVPRVSIAIVARRAWAVRGTARVKLACRGGAPGSACRGVLSLSRKGLLGRTRYALASGRARWVTVRLRPRARRWLRRAGRLRVLTTATTTGGNARRVTVLAPLRRALADRLR